MAGVQKCHVICGLLVLALAWSSSCALAGGGDHSRKLMMRNAEWAGATFIPPSEEAHAAVQCSARDIIIAQGRVGTGSDQMFSVQIINGCVVGDQGGCSFRDVHLSCGSFTSETIVNPALFKRVGPNDCLLKDGNTFAPGQVVSFDYSSPVQFPLAISSATLAC